MDTKQQIMSVAMESFIKNGYERTSLTDIAKVIGITKPAIYYHFENKDALFLAVLDGFLTEMEQWTDTTTAPDISLEEMLRRLFFMLKDIKGMMAGFTGGASSEAPTFHSYILMFEGIKAFPEIQQRVDQFYSKTIELMTQKIMQAQLNNEIRADINPQAFAFQLSATFEGTLLMAIFVDDIDMDTMCQDMFENTWKSIVL